MILINLCITTLSVLVCYPMWKHLRNRRDRIHPTATPTATATATATSIKYAETQRIDIVSTAQKSMRKQVSDTDSDSYSVRSSTDST